MNNRKPQTKLQQKEKNTRRNRASQYWPRLRVPDRVNALLNSAQTLCQCARHPLSNPYAINAAPLRRTGETGAGTPNAVQICVNWSRKWKRFGPIIHSNQATRRPRNRVRLLSGGIAGARYGAHRYSSGGLVFQRGRFFCALRRGKNATRIRSNADAP